MIPVALMTHCTLASIYQYRDNFAGVYILKTNSEMDSAKGSSCCWPEGIFQGIAAVILQAASSFVIGLQLS